MSGITASSFIDLSCFHYLQGCFCVSMGPCLAADDAEGLYLDLSAPMEAQKMISCSHGGFMAGH